MRRTMPEPKIKLYEEGFNDGPSENKHDQLGRKKTGERLSGIVESISEPLVIAVDGAWGSGKTHFLKCWVGEHIKSKHGRDTQTVYFDAFKNDFLDDPLIALTAEIIESSKRTTTPTPTKIISKIRESAPKVGRSLFRVGVAVATAGVVQNADEIGDAAAATIGGEVSSTADEFWKREDDKRQAMSAFREGLIELTHTRTVKEEESKAGERFRKLIIVVDELDRCRPDYALALLEVIKHVFNVEGIHFVLGVNLSELQNSVRARYGASIDAETYLQKFITLSMDIEGQSDRTQLQQNWQRYYDYCCEKMEFPEGSEILLERLKEHLECVKLERTVTLRDVERTLTAIATSPSLSSAFNSGYAIVLSALTVLKALRPNDYKKLRYAATSARWLKHFEFQRLDDRFLETFEIIETFVVDRNLLTQEQEQRGFALFDNFPPLNSRNFLRKLSDDHLEAFDPLQF
ncbi:KAP family P-loop domain protein [Falsiruegeria litorea R37]|uniref:KAP family P-loop domain protein n=1 Tax=Falsiruegeria litorea R37 TaxID=1200284 RepID=A0A1Y5TM29_9RHOB|nr:P-loop NTPase fold protein [Falsiruegeria litorea]SLN67164.1 KAP family P-loop domain protein [Falsiruegeria litorea R37]